MKAKTGKFIEARPPLVEAVQFKEKKSLDYEPVIHRSPMPTLHKPTNPEDRAEFVHTGTGNIVYPVQDGDWLCFVLEPLFPFGQDGREFASGRTFIMSDADFRKAFKPIPKKVKKKPAAKKQEQEKKNKDD